MTSEMLDYHKKILAEIAKLHPNKLEEVIAVAKAEWYRDAKDGDVLDLESPRFQDYKIFAYERLKND